MGQKVFSQISMKIATKPKFDMEKSKIGLIFPYFFIFIFSLASSSEKSLKKWPSYKNKLILTNV